MTLIYLDYKLHPTLLGLTRQVHLKPIGSKITPFFSRLDLEVMRNFRLMKIAPTSRSGLRLAKIVIFNPFCSVHNVLEQKVESYVEREQLSAASVHPEDKENKKIKEQNRGERKTDR